MSNTIKLKRGTSTPTTSNIASGEVAVDTSAQKLYINDSGTIKEIGGGGSGGGATGIDFNDNVKARWGTGNDLQIYHTGTNSHITNTTGDLRIQGVDEKWLYIEAKPDENSIVCKDDGAVDLYFDNSKKFETTSGGIRFFGDLLGYDSEKIKLGSSADLQIYHDGNNSTIKDTSAGHLQMLGESVKLLNSDGSETFLSAVRDGSVDLYYDNVRVFKTRENGIQVLGPEGGDAWIRLDADEGDDNDDLWRMLNSGSNYYLQNYAAGSWETNLLAAPNGATKLYFDNSLKFETYSSGVEIHGSIQMDDGNIARFGNSGDLQIYHTGSHSHVSDRGGAGNLNIESNNAVTIKQNDNESYCAKFFIGAGTELYHNNVRKLNTEVAGVRIDGASGGNGILALYSNAGNSNSNLWRLESTSSGSNFYIKNCASGSWENNILTSGNGQVELYYDDVKRFYTTASGADLNHTLNIYGPSGGNGNANLNLRPTGTAVYTNLYFHNAAGNSKSEITGYGGGSILFFTSSSFVFSSGGAERWMSNDSYLSPRGTDGSFDLGGSSRRWGDVYIKDSKKIKLGDGDDLEIFHNGDHSYIEHVGTGNLNIEGDVLKLRSLGHENYFYGQANNAAILYFDNAQKLATNSGGISVTGDAAISGHVDLADNKKLLLGTDDDIEFYSSGANGYLINDTGVIYVRTDGFYINSADNTEALAAFNLNGSVGLYYDHSKKLETQSTGVSVWGNLFMNNADGQTLKFGASNELQIYHHSNNWSYITHSGSGNLGIESANDISIRNSNGEKYVYCDEDGAVELYHNNVKTFQTSTHGGQFFAPEGGTCQVYFYADEGDDNNDLWGLLASHSSSKFSIDNYAGGGWETSLTCEGNGAVKLFYDDSLKLETSSDGIKVYDKIGVNITPTTALQFLDHSGSYEGRASWGNSADLQIYHDGNHNIIKGVQSLLLKKDDTDSYIRCTADAQVELYYDNSKKFETTSSGITINQAARFVGPAGAKECNWSNSTGVLNFQDEAKATFGTSNDLQIYANGSSSYITHNGDGHFYVSTGAAGENLYVSAASHVVLRANSTENAAYCEANGAVSLYYDGGLKFATHSNGVSLRGAGNSWCEGHFKPWAANTYDLGDSTYRWRNLYTNDLHLSNEGADGNSVDGTTGSWTIQEGADDLFIVNNKNGKKFKIALQEVS
jgi:hypothetical protein